MEVTWKELSLFCISFSVSSFFILSSISLPYDPHIPISSLCLHLLGLDLILLLLAFSFSCLIVIFFPPLSLVIFLLLHLLQLLLSVHFLVFCHVVTLTPLHLSPLPLSSSLFFLLCLLFYNSSPPSSGLPYVFVLSGSEGVNGP